MKKEIRQIDFIGMPINLGARRHGVEQGTDLLRDIVFSRRLPGWHDCGDIECKSFDSLSPESGLTPFLDNILDACTRLRDRMELSWSMGRFPFVAGGDHVLAWGSVAAFIRRYGMLSPKCLYIDAHGDFNSPAESPSHNMHGMHLAFATGMETLAQAAELQDGLTLSPKDIYFIGTRSLDAYEQRKAAELDMNFSRLYPQQLTTEAPTHISFDIDVLDPSVAPGTGVPEPAGLSLDECIGVLRRAFEANNVVSFDFVEINPLLDSSEATRRAASAVVDLVDSYILRS